MAALLTFIVLFKIDTVPRFALVYSVGFTMMKAVRHRHTYDLIVTHEQPFKPYYRSNMKYVSETLGLVSGLHIPFS